VSSTTDSGSSGIGNCTRSRYKMIGVSHSPSVLWNSASQIGKCGKVSPFFLTFDLPRQVYPSPALPKAISPGLDRRMPTPVNTTEKMSGPTRTTSHFPTNLVNIGAYDGDCIATFHR